MLPDYRGGSLQNLMVSIEEALGSRTAGYPELGLLPAASFEPDRNLVLLVIDGLGFDYLSRRSGALREHLRGAITSVCPATTASAITTFLTGAAPQQHGFTGWFSWFRELGSVLAILPFKARCAAEPLNGVDYTPADLCGATPLTSRLTLPSHTVAPDWMADSAFNRAFQNDTRMWPYKGLDGLFSATLKAVKKDKAPAFVYSYWPEYDSLSHMFGVGSLEVEQHFEQLDQTFGRFLKVLKGTGTRLIVTADHGFIDSPPERMIEIADHPELADTLILPLCGEPRLAYCYVHPERQERFEAYVGNELAHAVDLMPSSRLIEQGWFGLGEPHPELQSRVGRYTMVLKENYKVRHWLLGEKPHQHLGVHGGVSEQEMRVPLVVVDDL